MDGGWRRLLEPGRIGSMDVRNRIVMPPMGTSFGGPQGEVTQRAIDYYARRAQGGVGLITVENTLVTSPDKDCMQIVNQLRIDNHRYIPGFARLAEAVHSWGAKLSMQINYPGGGIDPSLVPGATPRTPTAMTIPWPKRSIVTKEISLEDIQELIEAYAQAALRVKLAGFDAVEVHCTHGYGIAAFISPFSNSRTDMYGGSLEKRVRFAVEVLEKVKEAVGHDFPVICRITAEEFYPGGLRLEEACQVAVILEKAGAHAIHLACGAVGELDKSIPPSYYPRGFLKRHAAEIKKGIRIPLITVGAINDPHLAEEMLEQGVADFVSMGRALIADPDIPKKLKEGRAQDVLRCTRCNDGCLRGVLDYTTVSCAINVEAGREREMRIGPAQKVKKVLVIGGGPGGMEAARVAALRGHKVTLWEKEKGLGGNIRFGSIMEFKEEYRWLIEWFERQLDRLKVTVEYNHAATAKGVEEFGADAVVVATGSTSFVPKIPGVERVVLAVDVLSGKRNVGRKAVIVGGGLVGCDLALHLALQAKEVTLIEMLDAIAMDHEPLSSRVGLLHRLEETGVKWFTGLKVNEIRADGVATVDKSWKYRTFEADTVILALGFETNNDLLKEIEGRVSELYSVGDCVQPRKVLQAIYEGSLFARRI